MSRRAERLFQIVQIINGRRLTTAAYLAGRLEVSERTIYRDINALSLSGVPVIGEAGQGYQLLPGYLLSPLMFSSDEVESLIAALRMVKTWSGNALARSADSAGEKLLAALSPDKRQVAEQSAIMVPDLSASPQVKRHFDLLHPAIRMRQTVQMAYQDKRGVHSARRVNPLGLTFWGKIWLLVAWCETRDDYRCFDLERCSEMVLTQVHFSSHPQHSLAHFIQLQRQQTTPFSAS
ncbi:YafY family protein [Citrobacter sp. JGM124]|uniref:helix-turn-helix transcriptional regulator n=1 Tax=Citrobacter sp. JGM124 TaxID=2799789 RepID=UPI001BA4ADD8|nr:YafY family protein [Citrobacter sp. JGM124]MBS0848744.1 YafY family transcriptional regulator [Citrobacter sp. JGM124]